MKKLIMTTGRKDGVVNIEIDSKEYNFSGYFKDTKIKCEFNFKQKLELDKILESYKKVLIKEIPTGLASTSIYDGAKTVYGYNVPKDFDINIINKEKKSKNIKEKKRKVLNNN